KWHLAHVSWFFETFVLAQHAAGYVAFDPAFRVLFNSYYNGVGDKHPRPERGLLSRPDLATVFAYRAHVDRAMQAFFAQPVGDVAAALVELGLNHEQQHQELLLTDVKHLFSRNPGKPVYHGRWPLAQVQPRPLSWHAFAAELATLGHCGDGFAFDNEAPAHDAYVAPFALASRPVTHGEFAQFIADGGYRRPELWLALGWDTVVARGWQAPLYWEREGDTWRTFTLHGMVDIDAHTPVCHVSLFEADAYARWAGARLPTEFEWELAARTQAIAGNFLDTGALHPLPLPGPEAGAAPAQLYGDVWEWTRSEYAPYPGYRPAPGAVGEYNGKFMCSQYVLRGGSCATPASHIRPTYRNFFPPDARWQFSGIRLARDHAA
ncbi:MAG: ergothioneine biosynthesis protein EgtB, partial [Casimicrobiaceae bacterium]